MALPVGPRVHHLHAAIAPRVDAWRAAGYPCATYPALAEVLAFQRTPHGLRHLRPPQLRALETYWYLRLVEGTPKIADLYAKHFPTRRERIQALGIPTAGRGPGHRGIDVRQYLGIGGLGHEIPPQDVIGRR